MILITVGTTHFPFRRMESVFHDICRMRRNNELVMFQHGATSVTTAEDNVTLVPYLDFDILNEYLRQARVVICHGGPSTIYQALLYGKKPWVLPRKKRYGEHVDDHQVCFTEFLSKKHIIQFITPSLSAEDWFGHGHSRRIKPPSPQLIQYLKNIK